MQMNKITMKLLFMLLFLSLASIPKLAFAAFDVHIQPVDGGNELRYGKVSAQLPSLSKSLAVSITSDSGNQYQLVQTLAEPLSNGQGAFLSDSNFSVYAVRDGNLTGTLSTLHELPVSQGRTIIYTSDDKGTATSFNLVYVIKNNANITPGSYTGKLVFMVEFTGVGIKQAQPVVINVAAEIESLGANIEITTATGAKTIVLNTAKTGTSAFALAVDCKEPLKQQFEIIQSILRLPESKQGKQIASSVLKVNSNGYKKGSGTGGSIPVSSGEQTLYISGPNGEADRFIITYSLADIEQQNAGNYRTLVQYFLKTQDGQKLLGTFPLEMNIDRVFDLIVTPEQGTGIQFKDVPLDKKPRRSKMIVAIHSNTGRQYQVSQQLPAAMVNKEGKSIPPQNFTLRLLDTGSKGTVQFKEPTTVQTGEMILFLSDKAGSSDTFEIIYEFSADYSIEGGDYAGRIVYTISEL
jgi:hypothetical protein